MRFAATLLNFAVFLACQWHSAFAAEPVELKVISFNVLVDFSPQPGVPKWADRKDLCIQVLREQNADLLGLQEPSPGQV